MDFESRHPTDSTFHASDPGADPSWLADLLLGLTGAAVGGAVGYAAFFLLVNQGMYAMIVPGTLLGMGCSALSGRRSRLLGAVCAVAAVVLGVLMEWQFAPFVADQSLGFFLRNLHRVVPLHLLMIVFGGAIAYWIGVGRVGGCWPRRRAA